MTFNWDDYVFVDCETGGLDVRTHPLLEVTYAVGLNRPVTLYTDIVGDDAMLFSDPRALEVNRYPYRFEGKDDAGTWVKIHRDYDHQDDHANPNNNGPRRTSPSTGYRFMAFPRPAQQEEWDQFAFDIKDKIWVGANPRFDTEFMEHYFYPEPLQYHHRLFDIQAYAAGKWGYTRPMSFREVVAKINGYLDGAPEIWGGNHIIQPDHTSYTDVLATREVFAALIAIDETGQWLQESLRTH